MGSLADHNKVEDFFRAPDDNSYGDLCRIIMKCEKYPCGLFFGLQLALYIRYFADSWVPSEWAHHVEKRNHEPAGKQEPYC